MKVLITLLFPLFFIGINQSFSQIDCMEKMLKRGKEFQNDTLTRTMGIGFELKKIEDLPFYQEFSFPIDEKHTKYFLINKSNTNSTLGIKVFTSKQKEMPLELIATPFENEQLFRLKAPKSDNYKVVLYSTAPDNSCGSLNAYGLKKELNPVSIPLPNKAVVPQEENLRFLKSYTNHIEKKDEMPYLKEFSYVFTKNKRYYFAWQGNKNLKMKVMNSKRETIELNRYKGGEYLGSYNSEKTGIYYIAIYSNERIPQKATLNLYFEDK